MAEEKVISATENMLSPAVSPASGVRKRTRIAEMLESSRKKRQVLREDLEKDRHRDLRRIGVEVGSKIFVRYEYDDLLEEENTEEPIVLESKVVWWPAKVCLYQGPGSYTPGDTEDGIIRPARRESSTSPRKDEQPTSPRKEEGVVPTVESTSLRIREVGSNSRVPEIVVGAADAGEERLYKAGEVFESMRASFATGAYVDRMAELVRENEDKIVYLLDYEGRDEFPPESVPCFFLDKENLVHLHQAWGFAAYRTDSVPSDEEEDGLFVDDLDSGSIVGQIADKVISVISRFYKHAETLNTKSISADDVWAYFDQIPDLTLILAKNPNDEQESHSVVRVTSSFPVMDESVPPGDSNSTPLGSSPSSTSADPPNAEGNADPDNEQREIIPSLQDAPFPRRFDC